MPGASFKELASYLAEVLPPDTTGETVEALCAQVAAWIFSSSAPNRESAVVTELASMGAKLEKGGPGSLGVFRVSLEKQNGLADSLDAK
jgi:hypothetical protein